MSKNLLTLTFSLVIAMLCHAQDISTIPNKSTLSFDLQALALNVNFSHKISKDFMVGIGVGAGPSNIFIVNNSNSAFLHELASARLFLSGNDNRKVGFSWEAGYKWSAIVVKNCKESCGGGATSFYLSPFWGGSSFKIGTQVGVVSFFNEFRFAWTPIILRYNINYPTKRKRKKLLKRI